MSYHTHEARRRRYRSKKFWSETADRLNLGTDWVSLPISALLDAGAIPCTQHQDAAALAADGMKILLSVASQVRKPSAIASVVERIESMTLQFENGKPTTPSDTFGATVTNVMRTTWEATKNPGPSAIPIVGIGVWWSDPKGSLLHGTIDDWTKGQTRTKKIYASAPLNLPSAPDGDWDFVQLPTVGGSLFAPLPLLGFFELFSDGVEDTAPIS